jgi:hypothetical protein
LQDACQSNVLKQSQSISTHQRRVNYDVDRFVTLAAICRLPSQRKQVYENRDVSRDLFNMQGFTNSQAAPNPNSRVIAALTMDRFEVRHFALSTVTSQNVSQHYQEQRRHSKHLASYLSQKPCPDSPNLNVQRTYVEPALSGSGEVAR